MRTDTALHVLREIVGQKHPNRWGYDAACVAMDDDWRARARRALDSLETDEAERAARLLDRARS